MINKIERPRSKSSISLIMSMITDRIGRHKVCYQLINHNYNKICDVLRFLKTKTQDIPSSEKKNTDK